MEYQRFEDRCRTWGGKLIKECWKEKEEKGWVNLYGKERGKFYARCGEIVRDVVGDRTTGDTDRITREMEWTEWTEKEQERGKRGILEWLMQDTIADIES